MSILLQDRSSQSGRTQPGSNLYKSTKWMDPIKGQDQSTKWTDPTRVTNLPKSTKWTDPTKGQDQSTKWMDPTRVKLIQVHKVDGPHQGSNLYKSTKWTDLTRVINLHKSTKWTDPTKGSRPVHEIDEPTSVKTYLQSGRAQPLSTYINPRTGRTLQGVKTNP